MKVELGVLAESPHADMIRALAERCSADKRVRAIWVGGSLAAGKGDEYSDIDFRVVVDEGTVGMWVEPDWSNYLPSQRLGGILLRFGDNALLHHMVLAEGTILDFLVHDTAASMGEPHVAIVACDDPQLCARIASFAKPSSEITRDIDAAGVRQFLVDYWIVTHKEMKGLARKYDASAFAGLSVERRSLLRALHMLATGKDISDHMTIHVLGALHQALDGYVTPRQLEILGMPTRTPQETIAAIDAMRAEMTRVGHILAERYAFEYPLALETVVNATWEARKEALAQRQQDDKRVL